MIYLLMKGVEIAFQLNNDKESDVVMALGNLTGNYFRNVEHMDITYPFQQIETEACQPVPVVVPVTVVAFRYLPGWVLYLFTAYGTL